MNVFFTDERKNKVIYSFVFWFSVWCPPPPLRPEKYLTGADWREEEAMVILSCRVPDPI